MLINAHYDIDEMAVCIEFHQGSKPVECVQGYTRLRMDSGLQLGVISVEYGILLPLLVHVVGLLVHVVGVPQCTKLRSQWFKGLDVQEGRTFQHLPCDERD
jgi:hypothetical protein